ncbi:MAG: helix-turn-helix domain-containing protein [Candidatus Marinimicrobia bacterium]|nr:helix-turn-helix domain-containing protein [Candidatus Neomarinimicrobiota bacterium]
MSYLLTGDDEKDRQRLQILLIINNTTQTEVARALGLSPQTVSGVIHRRYNLATVMRYMESLPRQLEYLTQLI